MKGKREPVKQLEPITVDGQGISQNQLCKQFGIDSKHLSRTAKSKGLTSQEFLEQQTGWKYINGKYYRPN